MSYTSSDPEYLSQDPETSPSASAGATGTTDQPTKKKKPWNKFKSGIKNIGEKMSSKPKFTDPTESSEQKRVKKGKKGKPGSEPKPTLPEDPPRPKSPPKNLMKKLSVDSLSTPSVGYQPTSVSPTKSYAKALYKSASTSESNLSASDIDTPKKSMTLDRNAKLSQESPDSGRASQTMGSQEGSRPPSSIREVSSDVSGDSDYASPRPGGKEEKALGDLVTKTEKFAQSLVSPKKEQDSEVTVAFLKAETAVKPPSVTFKSDLPKKEDKPEKSQSKVETPPSLKKDKDESAAKPVDEPKVGGKDALDGRKKRGSESEKGSKKEDSSLGLIASERSAATPKPVVSDTKPPQSKDTVTPKPSEEIKEKSAETDGGKKDIDTTKGISSKTDIKSTGIKTIPDIKPIPTPSERKGTNEKQEKPESKPSLPPRSETTKNEKTDKISPVSTKEQPPIAPLRTTKEEKPTTPSTTSKEEKPPTSSTITKVEKPATPSATKDEKPPTPTPPTKDQKPITPSTPTKDEKSTTPSTPTKDQKPTTPPTTKDEKPPTPTPPIKEQKPTTPSTPTIDQPTKDQKPTTESPKKDDVKPKSPTKTDPLSKPPTKTPDVPPPLTDVGAAAPQTAMSVEEKLQAFLSAEGLAGTTKDAPVKSANGSQQGDKRECLYKILVIGELGTGKTSIIKRYVHQFFSQHYRATIGVDFALKVLNWDQNTIIRLQLWDIAGQERFGNMTRVYYKEAVGAFIVFDVTRSATFDAVLKWKQDLDSKVQLADGSHIPCVLLANKCDQQKEGMVNTPAKMDEYCKENNFSAWFETSAKENINIDEAAKCLVTQILQNDKSSQNGRDASKDGGKFPLDGKSDQESKSCAC